MIHVCDFPSSCRTSAAASVLSSAASILTGVPTLLEPSSPPPPVRPVSVLLVGDARSAPRSRVPSSTVWTLSRTPATVAPGVLTVRGQLNLSLNLLILFNLVNSLYLLCLRPQAFKITFLPPLKVQNAFPKVTFPPWLHPVKIWLHTMTGWSFK